MVDTPSRMESLRTRWFPERQIYVRSDGRALFYTLSAAPQLLLFVLVLVFLTWASFVTVNVIFKDRIIAAADHRYQAMQERNEVRLAEAYASFDGLNVSLANTENRARAIVTTMQQKQAAFAIDVARYHREDVAMEPNVRASEQPVSEWQDGPEAGALVSDRRKQNSGSAIFARSGFYTDLAGIFANLLHSTKKAVIPRSKATPATSYSQHPTLKALEEDTKALEAMSRSANLTVREAGNHLLSAIGRIRKTIARTGIGPDQFVQRVASNEGVGGPDISLAQVRLEGISDRIFSQSYLEAKALLSQLEGLSSAIHHVPFALPMNAKAAHRSSGFGPRLDPFTGHYSFHPGLDFSGPTGTAIYATAPGTVVFAGSDGTFGNMVEIDHGYGFHTRYAHLSGITVQIGTRLTKGTEVGRLGTTGRSTGPHLHYEIRYDRSVRDPGRFLDAGLQDHRR